MLGRPGPLVASLLVAALAAGCLGALDPETSAETAGDGAATPGSDDMPRELPSDVAMAGAEVVARNATAVTFRWEGTMPPSVASSEEPVETGLTVPGGGHLRIDGTLTWEEEAPQESTRLVEFRVLDADGRQRCQQATMESIGTDGPQPFEPELHCQASPIPPLEDGETWSVQAWGKQVHRPTPFVVELTLSLLDPAHPVGPALPPGGTGPGNLSFGDPVSVAPQVGAHEPSVDVGGDGTVWVSGYVDRPGLLWRSTDDGATFEAVETGAAPYCNPWTAAPSSGAQDVDRYARAPEAPGTEPEYTHPGCGDVDLAAGEDGTVYWTQHYGGEAVAASHDGGGSWTTAVWASNEPAVTDRQWLATDGGERAWLVFNSPRQYVTDAAGEIAVSRTTDGGMTWRQVGAVSDAPILPGELVHDATRDRLYLPGPAEEGPAVSVSENGGETWTTQQVAERSGSSDRFCYVCGILVVGDVDAAGNLYVVWTDPSEGGTHDIWFASSTDGGETWSEPAVVNHVEGTHVMPWVSAGPASEAVVTWYGTAVEGNPQEIDGEWYVHAAVTRDAAAEDPTFTEALVSDHPVQFGRICLGGAGCGDDRNLGDLFEVAMDGEGDVHVSYTNGRAGGGWNDLSRVMYAQGGSS